MDHLSFSLGAACPNSDCDGHLHRLKDPQATIYLTGQLGVNATNYERPVLRCTNCFASYTAELPEEIKRDEETSEPLKYDPTADVTIVLYNYAAGTTFYR